MRPSVARAVRWLLAVLIIAAAALPAAVPAAHAQDRPKTLFDLLFNRSEEKKPARAAPTRSRATSSSSRSSRAEPAAPEPAPNVDKLDNARVVLVVGDFLAGGLADGLQEAYSESAGVRVVDRSNGSSGFVRDDYYDWPGKIDEFLDEEKPDVVVAMLGSNDRQAMNVAGSSERPRSEAWLEEYRARAARFAKKIRDRGIPLIWVGLPAFKSSTMSADMLAFNDIYKDVVEEAGGEFVDIWDGFVDENGAFTAVGPDMNGQRVRLRSSDGINLTRSGKRKLAFYVEKPLAKLLGNAVSPDTTTLDDSPIPDFAVEPEVRRELDRTAPISLYDPTLDGGETLLGAAPVSAPAAAEAGDDGIASSGFCTRRRRRRRTRTGTAQSRMTIDGVEASTQPGRADDFVLVRRDDGGKTAGSTASTGPETTTAITK